MKQNKILILKALSLLLLPLFILPSCSDKECKQTVQDVAYIQNGTGFPNLQIYVCKGNFGESRIQLAPIAAGYVNLGTREEVIGGADALGVCKTKNTRNTTLALTLSPNSHGSVLLCYRQVDNSYLVATITPLGCPPGYTEQISPESCPTSAN